MRRSEKRKSEAVHYLVQNLIILVVGETETYEEVRVALRVKTKRVLSRKVIFACNHDSTSLFNTLRTIELLTYYSE